MLNDASSQTQTVTNDTTLISVDHVNLLFGPFSSLLTLSAAPVAHRFGKALIEGAGGSPAVFATKLPNVFDVSLPVEESMLPLINYLKALAREPATEDRRIPDRRTTPSRCSSFSGRSRNWPRPGIKSVYYKVFPAEPTQYKGIADQVAATKADMVVLGSVDVPTVAAFTQAFVQQHYNPKIADRHVRSRPGCGVRQGGGRRRQHEGVMVPNAWYGGSPNPASKTMVAEYIAKYGGTASGVNADVAEAYSVGQVAAQAVKATDGTDNAKIISYLHSGVTLTSVQGPVHFNSARRERVGHRVRLPVAERHACPDRCRQAAGSSSIEYPKPAWGG